MALQRVARAVRDAFVLAVSTHLSLVFFFVLIVCLCCDDSFPLALGVVKVQSPPFASETAMAAGISSFVQLEACGQSHNIDAVQRVDDVLDDAWDSGTSTWPEVVGEDRTGSLGSQYNAIRLEIHTNKLD